MRVNKARRKPTAIKRIMMNILLPAAVAGAVSYAAAFLGPPIVAMVIPAAANTEQTRVLEGYYPQPEVCVPLGTSRPKWYRKNRVNSLCPQWSIDKKWVEDPERQAFITKLKEIESIAKMWDEWLANNGLDDNSKQMSPAIRIRRERGMAMSRMKDGIFAGNSEFIVDDDYEFSNGAVVQGWTDALLPTYIDESNVKPSQKFIDFVTAFDVKEFRNALEKAKSASSTT